jgi:drug/metabolite transporter (DMT)-like permease
LGVLFATAALFTFTIYFLITKHVRSSADLDPIQWIAGVTIWAALAVTPLTLLSVDRAGFAEFGGNDWIWLGFIVMVTGIAGHVLMSWVTRFIAASRSSLYLLSMNIVAISSAWLIHGETITLVQFLGGVVVFGAVTAVISRPPERVALVPT